MNQSSLDESSPPIGPAKLKTLDWYKKIVHSNDSYTRQSSRRGHRCAKSERGKVGIYRDVTFSGERKRL